MRNFLALGVMCSFLAGAAIAAQDVASAVVATVKTVDRGTRTVVVKTESGAEETLHFTRGTVAHGAEATGNGSRDAFDTMKEGDNVVVHYTVKGTTKTANEVDHIGKDGLKTGDAVVQSVNRGAKTVTVKTEDGTEQTYHLTDRAARESAKRLKKSGKVTVYYTQGAGKKVAHFFRQN